MTRRVRLSRTAPLIGAACLAPAFVTAVSAQAPRITQAGDPSVRSDTIYRLAVDPTAHTEESAYYLLDDGVVRVEADGRNVTTFRQVVRHPLDTAQARRVASTLAAHVFENADGDSLQVTSSAATMIFKLPLPSMGGTAQAARELEREPERRFAIDAAKVFGPSSAVSELRVTLPAGWRAQLPKSMIADGPFGHYETEYAQDGDVRRVPRRVHGVRGVHAAGERPALATWMRAVAKDDATFVVLAKPAG